MRFSTNPSPFGGYHLYDEATSEPFATVDLPPADARREFVEKKFARDTQRARLAWIRAKMFIGSSGGVTERNMAIDVSEEIARKGQEVREMTRDLDLVKVEVDIIASIIRFRGAPAPIGGQGEDASEGDSHHEDARAASD